ncbi:NDR1/HIN1-like protein 6 [Rutidosis leptorrhynchoides]|uniref:NDR1/HIN1-like protein 6 n=1 Tax=Rutidosis leptorrhynchoides TaxID=125765 RepID=UPI003A99E1A2
MTDRIYPSSKPTKTTTVPPLPPPPNKTQLPTTTTTTNRHPYRPNPTTIHRPRRRKYFCLCCFWSVLIIILLFLITTVAGCIFYLLYHPQRPSFSIAAVKISEFNLTTAAADDTTHLTSKFNLTVSTKNPNKKITFFYDTIQITCFSRDTLIANGSFRNPFISNPNNVSVHRSTLYGNLVFIETENLNKIKSDLKKKSGLPLKIILDTDMRVKIESIRSKKIGIRIKCDGIHSLIPKSNSKNSTSASVAANVSAAKCKIDLRIKIWKWTF